MANKNAITGKRHMRIIKAHQSRRTAMELRTQGKTYREIGDEMGVCMQEAHRLVKSAIDRVVKKLDESADTYRVLQLDRIDKLIDASWGMAMEGSPQHIVVIIKLLERQAKLTGIDQPETFEVSNPNNSKIIENIRTRLDIVSEQ